ncbi:MAG TPA: hypothetical protein VGJ84_10600 [Polyangiaceae bacterium]|jgi:DNA-binding response OmpR family regulator
MTRVERAIERHAGTIQIQEFKARPKVAEPVRTLELLVDEQSVCINGFAYGLTECQYALAWYVIDRTGRWSPTAALQRNVLRVHAAPRASNVRWHVSQLREAIRPYAKCVHGAQRRGYMWSTSACDTRHCQQIW